MISNKISEGDGVEVFVYPKGREKYIWIFHASRRTETMCAVTAAAANPNLSLSWEEASDIIQEIRVPAP